MANSPQSIKRARQAVRRTKINQGVRTNFRTMIKRARAVVDSGDIKESRDAFRLAQSVADSTARRGLVHPRTVARLKSRINNAIRNAAQSAENADNAAADTKD